MTTEYGNSDASRASEGRGLSRRQMIKASAVAGAAAWTAPVIIDSLSSPAAAGSCAGNRYYMKLRGAVSTSGDCFFASPGCNNDTKIKTGGNSPDSSVCTDPGGGYTWVCTGGNNHTGPFRKTFQITTTDYVITLADNCTFQPGQTTYTAVGNYDFNDNKYCISYPVTAGLNTVSIPKTAVIPDPTQANPNHTKTADCDYMYFEFVCT